MSSVLPIYPTVSVQAIGFITIEYYGECRCIYSSNNSFTIQSVSQDFIINFEKITHFEVINGEIRFKFRGVQFFVSACKDCRK